MFRGAIYATREECRSNPDWMAQSAHSLREILYLYKSNKTKGKKYKGKWVNAFRAFGSATTEEIDFEQIVSTVYSRITKVAHHQLIDIEDFEKLIKDYQKVLLYALARQVDIHKQIEKFLSDIEKSIIVEDDKKNKLKEKVQIAQKLINLNEDSHQYFFDKADETWLQWFWGNGFFEVLQKKPKTSENNPIRLPELQYLVRMTDLNPEIVTEIILATPISKINFNPDVLHQFLYICSHLPGVFLTKVIEKIREENWPSLLEDYNQLGIVYANMFEVLEKSGHPDKLLELANVVLSLRENWKIEHEENKLDPNPFCVKRLPHSKFNYYLSIINEKNTISFLTSILNELASLPNENQVPFSGFSHKDRYPLYDIDVFTIELKSEYHHPGKDDVREIVALVKILTERALSQQCDKNAKVFFERYFKDLNDSWLMWRIRLFVLSLCPVELMAYLKEVLFRIFIDEQYSELIMGAEYRKTLNKTFPLLSKEDQSLFISNSRELFSRTHQGKTNSRVTNDGSRIFSVIANHLSKDQIDELISSGFTINPEYYIPTPIFGATQSGYVNAKGPVSQDDFHKLSISSIITNLRGVWSPKQLVEQDTTHDFLSPLNAEGMGKLIKEDVKTRIHEYLEHINDFFDYKRIDLHYLYSVILGFVDAFEAITEPLEDKYWEILITFCLGLCQLINQLPQEQFEYEVKENNAWLSRWNTIFDVAERLLKKVLGKEGKELGFTWQSQRFRIFEIIKNLFSHPDPNPKDEFIETAKMTETVGNQKPSVSDPFTMAINSIRGEAFELFVLAVKLDTEINNKEGTHELPTDIKIIYEDLLENENTRAIKFMFGRYMPFFYFRDKKWLRNQLQKIFPKNQEEKFQYLAAWEGYLINHLYLELFTDENMQYLYNEAITIKDKDYPSQKHFIDPDIGVAQHFALAYVVSNFGFGDDLFENFWKKGRLNQHIAFVDKLGKFFISGKDPNTLNVLNNNPEAGHKLRKIWLWLLENYPDPNVFKGIGFWIDIEKGLFQIDDLADLLVKTLERTNGNLDWDIGLQNNIVELAKNSPIETLEITRLYLLEGGVRKETNSLFFILEENWLEVFHILYHLPETSQATSSLINDLIGEGGRFFWPLEKILNH